MAFFRAPQASWGNKKEENVWSMMDFSLPSISRPMWALAGAARCRQTRPILGGTAASPPAAPRAAAWLPKPTRVSALGAKFCFGRQTERPVQTSIFNLDQYLWQLQYYFKPFPSSRLQVERKIEKNTKPTPSPTHGVWHSRTLPSAELLSKAVLPLQRSPWAWAGTGTHRNSCALLSVYKVG